VLILALIHPSAWKENSPKFVSTILYSPGPTLVSVLAEFGCPGVLYHTAALGPIGPGQWVSCVNFSRTGFPKGLRGRSILYILSRAVLADQKQQGGYRWPLLQAHERSLARRCLRGRGPLVG
jgi:hypothetical protein